MEEEADAGAGELGCSVCQERYEERRRCPRNLGCGHSVCSSCLEEIIARGRKCPECRRPFYATTASALPVNYPLLRLSRTLAAGGPPQGPQQAARPASPATRGGSGTDAGECPAHLGRMTLRCMTCRVWVCRQCLLMDHLVPPEGQCQVVPVRQALTEMKKGHVESLRAAGLTLREVKKAAAAQAGRLEVHRAARSGAAAGLRALLQAETDALKELDTRRKEVEERMAEVEEWARGLREREAAVQGAATVRDLATAALAARDALNTTETRTKRERERQARFLATQPRLGTQEVKGALQLARSMYVVQQEEGGGQRWARLTLHDNQLHLHALHPATPPPPPSAPVFSFLAVRALVPREGASAFLEVVWAGQEQGRVYFRMAGSSARARQFLQLCSGEAGPSYRLTRMFEAERVGGEGEILRGGDYQNNDGTGGAGLVEGVTCGGEHLREAAPGLVVGAHPSQHHRLAVFGVILSPWPGHRTDTAFGEVTAGLATLRAAARHQPITEVLVQDCGLVIPL